MTFSIFIAAMAEERLKLLQFTQKVYQEMGIYPSQSNQNWHSINWRNTFTLFSFVQLFIFSGAFLIFEAETVIDAGQSFYTTDTVLWSTIFYLIQWWKMSKILKLIEGFGNFIEKSE